MSSAEAAFELFAEQDIAPSRSSDDHAAPESSSGAALPLRVDTGRRRSTFRRGMLAHSGQSGRQARGHTHSTIFCDDGFHNMDVSVGSRAPLHEFLIKEAFAAAAAGKQV